MNAKGAIILVTTALLIAGAVPVTQWVLSDPDPTTAHQGVEDGLDPAQGAAGPQQAPGGDLAASDSASSADGAGSTSGSKAPGSNGTPNLPADVGPDPQDSAYDLTVKLLGEPPAQLAPLDPAMSLADAAAQHPFTTKAPDTITTPAYLGESLSLILQAHGQLMAMVQASGQDPVASALVPYAAARLATVAEEASPSFRTATLLADQQGTATLTLQGSGEEIPATRTLGQELDRLATLLGIPSLDATPAASEMGDDLAPLVAGVNDVVRTAADARAVSNVLPVLAEDASLVRQALSDGALTPQEAAMVEEVLGQTEQLLASPLQARLDALNSLSKTAQAVGPTLTMPASAPSDPFFVDPLGLIVIFGNQSDVIQGGEPGSPELPIPQVGPLFPEGSLLILDLGGDDHYKGSVAVANGTGSLITTSPQGAGVKDTTDGLADTVEQPLPGGSIVRTFTQIVRQPAADQIRNTGEIAEETTGVETEFFVPHPVSLVIDLGGNDTYEGDRLAFAKAGGTAGIIDLESARTQGSGNNTTVRADAGHDTYIAKEVLGAVELDGFAVLWDQAGDDTYETKDGLGAVLPKAGGQAPLNLPTLASFIDAQGDDTYTLTGTGGGVAFYNETLLHIPASDAAGQSANLFAVARAHAVALDLGDGADGFTPTFRGQAIDPAVEYIEDGKGTARYWHVADRQLARTAGAPTANADCQIGIVGFRCGGVQLLIEEEEDGDETATHHFSVTALQRNWFPSVDELSNGTVTQTNTTLNVDLDLIGLSNPVSQIILPYLLHADFLPSSDLYPQAFGDAGYPAILIDGGGEDTYQDPSPGGMLTNLTLADEELAVEGIPFNLGGFELDFTTTQNLPMLVLDAGTGPDTYTGEIGRIEIADQANTLGQLAVLVDAGGNDQYIGNVTSLRINTTAEHSGATSSGTLLFDAGGDDTISPGTLLDKEGAPANLVGGLRVENAVGDLPASLTTLLLLGGQGENTITAGPGSMGAIQAVPDRLGGTFDLQGPANQLNSVSPILTSGAAVAGASVYDVGPASLGAIDWTGCIEVSGGCQTIPEPTYTLATFLGSLGSDTYNVRDRPAIGDVHSKTACDALPLTPNNLPLPPFITRFIDIGGGDFYHLANTSADLPPWKNDDTWLGLDCKGSEVEEGLGDCQDLFPPATRAVENLVCQERWQQAIGGVPLLGVLAGPLDDNTEGNPTPGLYEGIDQAFEEAPVNADRRRADALGVDNLAQFALRTATGAAGAIAGGTGLTGASICVGQLDDPSVENDLLVTDMDCSQSSPTIRESHHIMLKADIAVPLNLVDIVNPCDVGRQGSGLGVGIKHVNEPRGNPLAGGLSGCWGILELTPNMTEDPDVTMGDNPIWRPDIPTANSTFVALESAVRCSLNNEHQGAEGTTVTVPVLTCMTNLMPLPHHVDGTDGKDLGRVLLPEATYDYQLTFRGGLETLLGQDATPNGTLKIDYFDPFYNVNNQGNPETFDGVCDDDAGPPATGMLWFLCQQALEDPQATETYWEGLWVRPKAQTSTSQPQALEIWSPLRLDKHEEILPMLQHGNAIYAPDTSFPDSESVWNPELGLWMTTYQLEQDPELEGRTISSLLGFGGGDGPKLQEGTNEVNLLLFQNKAPDLVQFNLPTPRLDTSLVVEKNKPIHLDPPLIDLLEDPGAGIATRSCPTQEQRLYGAGIPCLRLEIPLRILDQSPIRTLTVGGVDDKPIDALEEEGKIIPGTRITWEAPDKPGLQAPRDQSGALACHDKDDCGFEVRLNRTAAQRLGPAGWERTATLNITFDPTDNVIDSVLDAARLHNEPFTLELPFGINTTDDTGASNTDGSTYEILIDLRRPADLVLTCGGQGRSLLTDQNQTELMLFDLTKDALGYFVEYREVGAPTWTRPAQSFLDADDLDEVDKDCTTTGNREWLLLPIDAGKLAGVEEGDQRTLQFRTIGLDAGGNQEKSKLAFEGVITFDLREPDVTVDQVSTEPDELVISVEADEAIRVISAELGLANGALRNPVQGLPTGLAEGHELTFRDLPAGESFELSLTVVDQVGHQVTLADLTAETAKTMNVTLAQAPDVAGDEIAFGWIAGALAPGQGGDPSVDVAMKVTSEDTVCAQRTLPTFVNASMEDPAAQNATLALTDCPAGPLTLSLTFSNNLEDRTLTRQFTHDVAPPKPGIDVRGTESPTGWFTSAVTVVPTAEDDTSATAVIVRGEDTTNRLDLTRTGVQTVTVRATDAAGRTTTETFEVPIDLEPPTLQLVPKDPLPAENPILDLQIDATDDASGVRAVRTLQADGTFGDWFPVLDRVTLPVDIRGLDTLVAEAIDRAGHKTRAVLPLNSLLEAPELQEHRVLATGPGTIQIDMTLDRPTPLIARALVDDRQVAKATGTDALEQRILLTGVTPDSQADVRVSAELRGGGETEIFRTTLQMPADQSPPTAPRNLQTTTSEDGIVRLAWSPSTDDAGIDTYIVQRFTGETSQAWITNRTTLADDPEPGLQHTYRVKATDVMGHESAWSQAVTVTPETPLRMLSYDFTPEVVQAGQAVNLRLVLEASERPENVSMILGSRAETLHLEGGTAGTWIYELNTTFPATDVLQDRGLHFEADGVRLPANGSLPGPVVQVLSLTADEERDDVPLPIALVPLAILAAATLLRRRWTP